MRLNPARFNRFLAKIGQDLAWRPSNACPCVQPYSGSPDSNCLHCGGKGRLWSTPVPCSAGIVSRDIMRQAAPMAILDAGDVMLVIPSDQPIYAIGEYDRVVMTDRTEPFSLNLIAGVNALRFNPVSIDRITWLDAEGKLVVGTPPTGWANGQLTWPPPEPEEEAGPDEDEVEPEEDEAEPGEDEAEPDPEEDEDEPVPIITPPDGVTVAITGRRHPEYFCWLTLALDRPHHSGEPLPRRVVLRRFDLFGA